MHKTVGRVTFRLTPDTMDSEIVRRMVAGTEFFSAAEVAIAQELIDVRLAKGQESGYEFIFAELEEQTIGYACYGEIPCTVGSYDLYWIVVDRNHQNLGVGRQLLVEAERQIQRLRGRAIYVETSGRAIYEPTRAFYLRCAYTQLAIYPDFYAPADDKFVYVKQVSPLDIELAG